MKKRDPAVVTKNYEWTDVAYQIRKLELGEELANVHPDNQMFVDDLWDDIVPLIGEVKDWRDLIKAVSELEEQEEPTENNIGSRKFGKIATMKHYLFCLAIFSMYNQDGTEFRNYANLFEDNADPDFGVTWAAYKGAKDTSKRFPVRTSLLIEFHPDSAAFQGSESRDYVKPTPADVSRFLEEMLGLKWTYSRITRELDKAGIPWEPTKRGPKGPRKKN